MENINRLNVVHRFRKRKLLIAINCVAALSIFFFGYDQGMMAGVNNVSSSPSASAARRFVFGVFSPVPALRWLKTRCSL